MFILWIYCACLLVQLKAELISPTNLTSNVFPENGDFDSNSVSDYQIVFPRVYHMSRRKRRTLEEEDGHRPAAMLILRSQNATYYVELELNEDLSRVPVTLNHGPTRSVLEIHRNVCNFHGKIISVPGGRAAISTCSEDGSVTGILMTPEGTLFLNPSISLSFSSKGRPHVLQPSMENKKFCGVGDVTGFPVLNDLDADRRKRSPPAASGRKVMEVAVFVDSDLFTRISATAAVDGRRATVRRVLGIMNQVQLIYNYSSLETKFKLVLVKIEILKSNEGSPSPENGDIDKYLDSFCVWQSKRNVKEGSAGHWDHAIMLTGKDLYKESVTGRRNPKVLGLAWVNGMCRSNYSCTLNEGTSFEAAFVIAHEMAHNLGVMHDGSGNNCDRNRFIMSDKTGPGKVNWSSCSNVYIKKFFGSGYGRCLEDDAAPPNRSYDLQQQSLPGTRYTLADQCKLALGSAYAPHQDGKEPFNNVCRELWCASGSWAKPAHPALEGSPCSAGKLCLEGSCRSSAVATLRRSNSSVSQRSSRRSDTDEDSIFKRIQDAFAKMIRHMG